MSDGSDKRRFARLDVIEPATIVVGRKSAVLPAVKVFTETLDVSDGGARLRHPTRFITRIGELFDISSPHIGTRSARIVDSSPSGLHVAFAEPPASARADDHPLATPAVATKPFSV